MATPDNIDTFNRICIAVFDKLYSEFPVPVDIRMNDLAMSAVPEGASFDSTWDILSVGREAINFLADEGFLTHKGGPVDASKIYKVRLTMKGLDVLGNVPASIQQQEAAKAPISQIKDLVKGGLKQAGSEAIRQVVAQVFGAMMGGMS